MTAIDEQCHHAPALAITRSQPKILGHGRIDAATAEYIGVELHRPGLRSEYVLTDTERRQTHRSGNPAGHASRPLDIEASVVAVDGKAINRCRVKRDSRGRLRLFIQLALQDFARQHVGSTNIRDMILRGQHDLLG